MVSQLPAWVELPVVYEIGQDLGHPIGARISGFAHSHKLAMAGNEQGDLSPVVDTIVSFCSAMKNVVYSGFSVLEEIHDDQAEAYVYAAIEKATFKQLDADVFGMFCAKYCEEDARWSSCVARMRTASPADHGVNPKYILDARSVFPNLLSDSVDSNQARAGVYQPAVDKLRELHQLVHGSVE